jgi:tetratricopeptide (TPR) repeat protein
MAQVTVPHKQAPRLRMLSHAVTIALVVCVAPAFAQNATGLDQQAREAAWAGRTAEALHLLEQHLSEHPDDRAARLDRARYLAWGGDYAGALANLDALGGDDDAARALRARVQGWAGRRDAALALNAPLYQAAPDNYDNAWTQALIARLGEWPQEALPALATVQRLQPESKDSIAIAKVVRLPLYSWVGLPASVYQDSDDIEIRNVGVEANLRLSDTWRLLADATDRRYEAPAAGPFAPLTGGDSVDEHRVGIGARLSASPDSTIEFWAGNSRLDFDNGGGTDSAVVGRMQFAHRASDDVSFTVGYEVDRVAYSPRALSFDIMRNGAWADLHWTPGLRDTVNLHVSNDSFSDDNDRQAVSVDYRHAVHRGGKANIDIGLQGDWLHFSNDPGHGYYSPDSYRRIAPVVSSYIALGPEAGLYLSAAVGMQRDETFGGWKRASDVGAGLTLGVFTHWQLVATAGYAERLSEFGRYHGKSFGLQLRYRFCEFRADRCPTP